ncbi:hypothetical protein [Archaeoglobus sp.]
MSKFYLIAGFIFVFNLVVGMLNALDLGYTGMHDPTWAETVHQQVLSANQYGSNPITDTIFAIGDFIRSLPWFVQALFYATVLFPLMLYSWGLPSFIVTALTAVVWLSYLAAIIEFISGRSVER